MNRLLRKNPLKCLPNPRRLGPRWGLWMLLVMPSVLAAGCGGCSDSSTSLSPGGSGPGSSSERAPGGLLEIAVDNLDRQEDFPSGEMLQQIVEQLNGWVRAQQPRDDWKPDPLLAGLPAPLARLQPLATLGQLQFPLSDGLALQEAVWLRNVSRWARGGQLDELSQAEHLFDWTVRNVQLEAMPDPETDPRLAQMPWETLQLGRGTAVERAWVFILLARQLGLDAALLALLDADDPAGRPPLSWAVGLLIQGEVYLFDPALGLPIPGPEGVRLGDAGPLEIRPATLAQLAADDALLRRLDLDPQRPYPVSSTDLDRVVALVEASPSYLARRMKLVESRLLGQRRIVLSTSLTAAVERWKAAARIADARPWTFPFEVLLERQEATGEQLQPLVAALMGPFYVSYATPADAPGSAEPLPRQTDPTPDGKGAELEYRPQRAPSRQGTKQAPLRRARILHLKGQFTGPGGATEFYQDARPSDDQLADLAKHYYELNLREVQKRPKEDRPTTQQLEQVSAELARLHEPWLRRAKQDASYWLGLVNFDQGLIESQRNNPTATAEHYQVAVEYFLHRTLEASPDGPWTDGANYNLARCYEATRQYDQAISHYTSSITSPSYYGNILRARWLNERRPPAKEEPAPKDKG